MALRDIRRRLTAPSHELHRDGLRDHWAPQDTTAANEVVPRTHATVGGEIRSVRVTPRAGAPALEAEIDDGTGVVVAVFTGRRAIGGVVPGRRMLVEGLIRTERRRLVVLNPAYTLLP